VRAASDRLLRVVTGSHVGVCDAWLVEPGQTGTTPAGVKLELIDGLMRSDAASEVRSTLDLTLGNSWDDQSLNPFGPEVYVRRGVSFGGGSTEMVGLGYFKIYDVEQEDAPLGALRVSAQDRMAPLIDDKLPSPLQFDEGTAVGDVVDELVFGVYPWATIVWDDDTNTEVLSRALVADEDRYPPLYDLLTSYGKVFYWDYQGYLQIASPPDPSSPVWSLGVGQDGVLTTQNRFLSREGIFNGVVVRGEGGDTLEPVYTLVVDLDPNSPTYWHGPFGHVIEFLDSAFVGSTAQAITAARSLLRQRLGLPHRIDLSLVPNPALEVLDPVRIQTPEGWRTHVLETLTIPLSVEKEMRGTTRDLTTSAFEVLSGY
jgi:Domain of unknown function (DUF5047)